MGGLKWDQAFDKFEEIKKRSDEIREKYGYPQGFTFDLFLIRASANTFV